MSPYKTIWYAPKRAFEDFFEKDEKKPIYFFPFLISGLSMGISLAADTGNLFGDMTPILTALAMISIGIGGIYLAFGLILPGLTKFFGSIWKGKSTLRQMTNVYAISLIPHCIILTYQVALFISGKEPTHDNINVGLDYLIHLWTLGLLTLGVAKVQRFSYGFALVNVVLAHIPFIIIELF